MAKVTKSLTNEQKIRKGFHYCPHCGILSNGRNRTYEDSSGKLRCDVCHGKLDKRVYREASKKSSN